MRIVSLVPSLTELVCELGLVERLVGRTGYCIHPTDVLSKVPKVGGTKQINHAKIRALAPTHVLLNRDENRLEDVEKLQAYVPHLVITHPCKLIDNLALYVQFGEVFDCQYQAQELSERFSLAFDELQAWRQRKSPKQRTALYMIWREPWMTISSDTYIADFLQYANMKIPMWNTPRRYPELNEATARAADPQCILFSSEPYAFSEKDFAATADWAPANVPRSLIDGELLSWYGPRAIAGLQYLRKFHDAVFPD